MMLYKGPLELIDIALVALLVFTLIVVYTRWVGLRSFAKMTSTDFATTIAVGSMIAAVILPSDVSILGGCFGIFMVYLLQLISSWLKVKVPAFGSLIENSPVIVMKDGQILKEELAKVNMTKGDLIAKLREANVLDMSNVQYVVFESTGDVSVLHGSGPVSPSLVADILGPSQISPD